MGFIVTLHSFGLSFDTHLSLSRIGQLLGVKQLFAHRVNRPHLKFRDKMYAANYKKG